MKNKKIKSLKIRRRPRELQILRRKMMMVMRMTEKMKRMEMMMMEMMVVQLRVLCH